MEALEQGMREAALRDGSKALSMLLSEIPDYYENGIFCVVCDNLMENIGRREKGRITLFGEGNDSRM